MLPLYSCRRINYCYTSLPPLSLQTRCKINAVIREREGGRGLPTLSVDLNRDSRPTTIDNTDYKMEVGVMQSRVKVITVHSNDCN